jgi:hypothetical protein
LHGNPPAFISGELHISPYSNQMSAYIGVKVSPLDAASRRLTNRDVHAKINRRMMPARVGF